MGRTAVCLPLHFYGGRSKMERWLLSPPNQGQLPAMDAGEPAAKAG